MFELFDPESDFQITVGTHLPHWFQPALTYFVTFRTEDSIPADVSRRWYAERQDWLIRHGIQPQANDWREKLASLPRSQRKEFHSKFSEKYLENLDQGWGRCFLKRSELSKIVADSLFCFDGQRYHMGSFVVMPNHVHLVACLLGDTNIVKQCTSWKRFTANKINQLLGITGRFWQEESFDHLVRSDKQFFAINQYIAANPRNLPASSYFLHKA